MKQKRLSKKEINEIHLAADLIEDKEYEFSCNAIDRSVDNSSTFGDLRAKYAKFFAQHERMWEGLSPFTGDKEEQRTQRLLMLELFAHLKGIL